MADIKAIIADDEEQLRNYLRSKLSGLWPELIICGEAENGPEALKLIENNRPEIAFLDIKMPGMSGIEVARRMTASCNVVFITAYDQYAIEAFENQFTSHRWHGLRLLGVDGSTGRLPNQVCLRSRDAFWDIPVPKTHSIFDNR